VECSGFGIGRKGTQTKEGEERLNSIQGTMPAFHSLS